MGDLDFDVRIKTAYGDPGTLMAAVGRSVAQGSFRVPVRLDPGRPFELVLVTRLGATAARGTAEVVRYEGNATWVRFLSASDQRGGDANLILWDVEVSLAPGLAAPRSRIEPAEATHQALPRLGTEPPRAAEGMPVSTAPPSNSANGPAPPTVPTAARRAAVPVRSSQPQPVTQKVVAVPPKARGTDSNTSIADRRATPILAPSGDESPPVPPTSTTNKPVVTSTAGIAPPAPPPAAVAVPVLAPPPVAPPPVASASTMARAKGSGSAADSSPSIDSPAPALPTPLRALSAAAFAAREPPPMSLPSSVVPWWRSSGSPPPPRHEQQERPALASRRMPTSGAAEHSLDVIVDAEGETGLTSATRSPELAATEAAARTVAPAPVISPDRALAVVPPSIERAAARSSPGTAPTERVIGSSTPFDGSPAHFDGTWMAPGPRTPQHPARAATQPPVRLDHRVLRAAIAIAVAGVAVAVGAIWWAHGVHSRSAQHEIGSRACGPETPPAAPAEPIGANTAAMISSSSAAVPTASAPAAVSAGDRCQLRIASNADPVALWIDGKVRGTSPALVDIPCRPATVELRHPRYSDALRRIAPEPGITNVDIKLVRPVVTMKILSRPLGATVRVNGQEVGRTPVTTSVNAFERGTIIWTHSGGATKTLQIYPQTDGTVVTATLPTLPPVIKGARPGTTR